MSDPRLTAAQMLRRLCDSHDAYRAEVAELTAENAALKADIIYMAREAGNAMPVDEMLNKLRTAREESDE